MKTALEFLNHSSIAPEAELKPGHFEPPILYLSYRCFSILHSRAVLQRQYDASYRFTPRL